MNKSAIISRGALVALATVVAAAAVAGPNKGPSVLPIPTKEEKTLSPIGYMKVRNGKVGPIQYINPQTRRETRNVPSWVVAYDNYQINPATFDDAAFNGSTNLYGTQQGSFAYAATTQCFNYMNDMVFANNTAGRLVRGLQIGYNADVTRPLVTFITTEMFQDRSGFGPASGFSGDGIGVVWADETNPLTPGFYRLPVDLTLAPFSDDSLYLPANSADNNGNGINEIANGLSVTMASLDANGDVIPITTGGGGPALRHNLAVGDPVFPGTAGWNSDAISWQDLIDPSWTGTGSFSNSSNYIFEDETITAGLGANAYNELFNNVQASTARLHPAFTLLVDNNARVIKGTVSFSDLSDPATAPTVVFAQVNVGSDTRIVPIVNGNFEILDTNQLGAGGVRTLSFKVDHWLRENITVDTSAGSVTGVNVDLNDNGDANFDNAVDLLDFFDLSDAYNKTIDDTDWFDVPVPANPVGPGNLAPFMNDTNRDDSVDLLDYFILSDNYNEVGADPLP